uniref:Protein kinase domain-containing protein n=1 Tax=Octactis speculum TaxID=3111310 RepID=A0A6U3TXQ3_9STRA|mmetsp:Transcript_40324/g.54870  ORF Transcript_40324/g.54870 Transcript_40324/m.54870 type:complete len:855 (+) Transcript_40324:84-2648(+)|eukprot:CAMPEP_0185797510 /NCGR_PEP_ID=MMETSP1174-20130828/161654_1 /TAXON_ID=35687 /ORGANISM="Dictyocha speculum, Strain CCMP1381" /LENGTH=854 /DNA_ID=CAMNT_0028492949 /DNA_START=84 /DNA_END=2648 /DNA_ORIENTATION=-
MRFLVFAALFCQSSAFLPPALIPVSLIRDPAKLRWAGTKDTSIQTERRAKTDSASAAAVAETAVAVATAVSRTVSQKNLQAPDASNSLLAIDDESGTGVGDIDEESGLPLVYNKELIEKYWDKESGALQSRWREFLQYSVPWLTRVATLLVRGGTDELLLNDASLAREARIIMEKLGPTYVKLGQVMSVRPDILPQAALKELSILQDSVPPFSTEEAKAVITRQLKRPISEVFSDISDEPVASASLAQVYKATLKSNGEAVAVKVQRPSVLDTISKDLYVLRRASEVYQGLVDRFAPQQRTDYVALLNEWAVGLYNELDFLNEGKNQMLVKKLLEEQNVPDVYVPKVYDDIGTRRLLVTEWVDGVKLSSCEPHEIKELIAVGQEAFLVQLLQVGVFHSDPHPGNLLRLNDTSKGKLALIDFGLVARLKQSDMDTIVSAVIHLANKDYASLVDDFISLDILPNDCDRSLVVPLMDKALTPYVKGGGAKRYEEELKKSYGFDDVGAVGGFSAMTTDFLTVLNDIPFAIPPYFALIGKAVVTLEGVALLGDPDYGLITEAYPFVARKLLSEDRPEIQRSLEEVLYGSSSLNGGLSAQRLASLVNGAMGAVARSNSFVDLDALPAEAMEAKEILKFLLSDKASSVLSLLEPEVVKGADLLARQAIRKSSTQLLAKLPRPRLPVSLPIVGRVLGPPPDQVPGPLLLTGAPGSEESPRLVFVTPAEVVEALAPPLTRDEELYAISLMDLVAELAGPEAASLVSGQALVDGDLLTETAPLLLEAAASLYPDNPIVRLFTTLMATLPPPPAEPNGGRERLASLKESLEADLTEFEKTRGLKVIGVLESHFSDALTTRLQTLR